jgi:hypothetical protein
VEVGGGFYDGLPGTNEGRHLEGVGKALFRVLGFQGFRALGFQGL